MDIKQTKQLLKDYKILSVNEIKTLYCITVKLKDKDLRFDLPKDLTESLYSFTIYEDELRLFFNKY